MMHAVRPRVVLYAALPLVLPLGALLWFIPNCEDDWCTGGIAEAIGYDIVFAALVLGAAAYLSTRAIRAWRAGLGAWSFALGVASLWFAASQVLEADSMTALTWLWMAGALLVGAIVLARPNGGKTRPAKQNEVRP